VPSRARNTRPSYSNGDLIFLRYGDKGEELRRRNDRATTSRRLPSLFLPESERTIDETRPEGRRTPDAGKAGRTDAAKWLSLASRSSTVFAVLYSAARRDGVPKHNLLTVVVDSSDRTGITPASSVPVDAWTQAIGVKPMLPPVKQRATSRTSCWCIRHHSKRVQLHDLAGVILIEAHLCAGQRVGPGSVQSPASKVALCGNWSATELKVVQVHLHRGALGARFQQVSNLPHTWVGLRHRSSITLRTRRAPCGLSMLK